MSQQRYNSGLKLNLKTRRVIVKLCSLLKNSLTNEFVRTKLIKITLKRFSFRQFWQICHNLPDEALVHPSWRILVNIYIFSSVTRKSVIRKTGVPNIDLLPMVSVPLWIIFNAATDQMMGLEALIWERCAPLWASETLRGGLLQQLMMLFLMTST